MGYESGQTTSLIPLFGFLRSNYQFIGFPESLRKFLQPWAIFVVSDVFLYQKKFVSEALDLSILCPFQFSQSV